MRIALLHEGDPAPCNRAIRIGKLQILNIQRCTLNSIDLPQTDGCVTVWVGTSLTSTSDLKKQAELVLHYQITSQVRALNYLERHAL